MTLSNISVHADKQHKVAASRRVLRAGCLRRSVTLRFNGLLVVDTQQRVAAARRLLRAGQRQG